MSVAISERLSLLASALSVDPRQAPRAARLAGFKGLLFDVWSPSLNIADLSATGRREFHHLLANESQQLVGLQMDLGDKGLSLGADVDKQIARLDRAMESAASMQTPLLCVDLGPLPLPPTTLQTKPSIQNAGVIIIPTLQAPPPTQTSPPPDPALVSQVNSALLEIGERADRYNMTLAFSTSLASFAALQQALISANCPWFGIDLDTVAILRDEWSQDEIFSAVGQLIRHVRAGDAIIGADNRTKPAVIGHGSTDWRELLAALDATGYHGFITIDSMEFPDRLAAANAGAKYLREISK
jgi:sugar phosphate isomerase/epimerase